MYDRVLVPTDGSEHAARAAEHALQLAELLDAEVHLLHAVDLEREGGPFSAGGADEGYVERLHDRGREAFETVRANAGESASIETELVEGRPVRAVLDYAADNGIDLVVMGTHGRTGVRRYVMGSVAEGVVRKADVPVVSVRATDQSRVDDGYEEVLVPTDGSDAASAAVAHALAVADAAGARVHALTVVDADASSSVATPAQYVEDLEAAGEEATEGIAARARDAGLDAVTEVRTGHPAEEILAYAEANDVDLAAMGTTGRTGPSRYLLGSTTERVVRHSPVPVLSVNARES